MSLKHKKWRTTQVDDKSSPELEVFTNNCDKLFQKFALNKMELPERKIYHYTKVDALMNILKTRSLWMSEFKFLNISNGDQEIIYAIKQLFNLIKENCSKSPYIDFWHHFLFPTIHIPLDFNIYICSYCLDIENQHLWDKYADNGKGAAIGFNTKYFFQKKSIRNSKIMSGQKVHYHTEDFCNYILNLTQITEKLLKEMKATSPFNDNINKNIGVTLLTRLISLLPKLKESKFSAENEYRTFRIEFASDKIVPKKIFLEYQIPPQEKIKRNTVNGKDAKAIYKFKRNELSEIWLGQNCPLKEICIKKILHKYQYTNVMIQHI